MEFTSNRDRDDGFASQPYRVTSAVANLRRLPRFGHGADFAAFFSSRQDEQSDYAAGLVSLAALLLIVFVFWTMVVLTFKAMGQANAGFLSGHHFVVERKTVSKRPGRVRVAFLIATTFLMTSTFWFIGLGLTNVSNATATVSESLKKTEVLMERAELIALDLEDIAENSIAVRDAAVVELEGFCPSNPNVSIEGVVGVQTVGPIERTIYDLTRLANFIREALEQLSKKLALIRTFSSSANDSVKNIEVWNWEGKLLTAGLFILSSFLAFGVGLVMLDMDVKFYQKTLTYILMPLFVVTIIACSIACCAVLAVAATSADACSGGGNVRGGPDDTVLTLYRNFMGNDASLLTDIVTFYTQQCSPEHYPYDFISSFLTDLDVARNSTLDVVDKFKSSQDRLEKACDKSFDDVIMIANEMVDNLDSFQEQADLSLDLLHCKNVNQIYTSTVHGAGCTYSVDALAWTFASLLLISICGLTMITLRAAYYPIEIRDTRVRFSTKVRQSKRQSTAGSAHKSSCAKGSYNKKGSRSGEGSKALHTSKISKELLKVDGATEQKPGSTVLFSKDSDRSRSMEKVAIEAIVTEAATISLSDQCSMVKRGTNVGINKSMKSQAEIPPEKGVIRKNAGNGKEIESLPGEAASAAQMPAFHGVVEGFFASMFSNEVSEDKDAKDQTVMESLPDQCTTIKGDSNVGDVEKLADGSAKSQAESLLERGVIRGNVGDDEEFGGEVILTGSLHGDAAAGAAEIPPSQGVIEGFFASLFSNGASEDEDATGVIDRSRSMENAASKQLPNECSTVESNSNVEKGEALVGKANKCAKPQAEVPPEWGAVRGNVESDEELGDHMISAESLPSEATSSAEMSPFQGIIEDFFASQFSNKASEVEDVADQAAMEPVSNQCTTVKSGTIVGNDEKLMGQTNASVKSRADSSPERDVVRGNIGYDKEFGGEAISGESLPDDASAAGDMPPFQGAIEGNFGNDEELGSGVVTSEPLPLGALKVDMDDKTETAAVHINTDSVGKVLELGNEGTEASANGVYKDRQSDRDYEETSLEGVVLDANAAESSLGETSTTRAESPTENP